MFWQIKLVLYDISPTVGFIWHVAIFMFILKFTSIIYLIFYGFNLSWFKARRSNWKEIAALVTLARNDSFEGLLMSLICVFYLYRLPVSFAYIVYLYRSNIVKARK